MRVALVLAFLPTVLALPAFAGGEEPAARPLSQASAKAALSETKLDDTLMSAVYTDMEGFVGAWSRHVLEVGPAAARAEDLREVVDAGVRDKLQDRGIALSQQEAIVDALVLRSEAVVRDYEAVVSAQAKVKRALEDSMIDEPALSDLFSRILGEVDDSHVYVMTPSASGEERVPAAEIVASDFAPGFERAEIPEKHSKALQAAIVQWLEARASFEAEMRAR